MDSLAPPLTARLVGSNQTVDRQGPRRVAVRFRDGARRGSIPAESAASNTAGTLHLKLVDCANGRARAANTSCWLSAAWALTLGRFPSSTYSTPANVSKYLLTFLSSKNGCGRDDVLNAATGWGFAAGCACLLSRQRQGRCLHYGEALAANGDPWTVRARGMKRRERTWGPF